MAPLVVEVIVTVIARIVLPWPDAVRIGLAVMFMFTGASHFSSLRTDLAAMIPPPFTGAVWIVYVTGMLELAGAVGLLVPKIYRIAALGLVVMLLGIFPANVFAAVHGVTLRGQPPTPLALRMPLQAFWMAMLWWSAVKSRESILPQYEVV
jgi:uncharacterized membrane protein